MIEDGGSPREDSLSLVAVESEELKIRGEEWRKRTLKKKGILVKEVREDDGANVMKKTGKDKTRARRQSSSNQF